MFRGYTTLFRFSAAAAAIVLAILCAIKCETTLFAVSSVPRIAVFAAVVNTAFLAYRARSDPIMSTIPDPPYLYFLIAKRLLLYTIIMMLLNER